MKHINESNAAVSDFIKNDSIENNSDYLNANNIENEENCGSWTLQAPCGWLSSLKKDCDKHLCHMFGEMSTNNKFYTFMPILTSALGDVEDV